MDSESYEKTMDEEVATARIEGLIEDTREQHDIEFEGLTNYEVLMLSTALTCGVEHFADRDIEPSAYYLQTLQRSVQEQSSDLFEELYDIHEPFIDQALREGSPSPPHDQTESTSTSPSASQVLKQIIQSPFGSDKSRELKIWQYGLYMVLLQIGIGFINGATLIMPLDLDPTLSVIALITAVIGAPALAFVLGLAVDPSERLAH